MRFGDKIKNALARWMYGRNGVDRLNITLLWVAVAVSVAGMFVRSDLVHAVLNVAGTGLAAWTVFRMLSRDLPRRRAENAWFMQKVLLPLQGGIRRMRDRDHRYFTCPSCRAVCRVPRGKGTVIITCPRCRTQIRGKS